MIDPNLPLIDLHRHLEGAIRLETILELGNKHDLPLPAWDLESLRPHVQVTEPQPGVMAFISKIELVVQVMVDYQACSRIAYENVQDAHSEGLDYLELRFSPWFMAEPHGLDPEGVVDAVVEGVSRGVTDTGLKVNLVGILSRTYGPEVAWNELEALLRSVDSLVAIDLAGDESNFPGHMFVDQFRKVRASGLQVTVHAGESAGPGSIWQAIDGLGAARIGHAVHALDDPALVAYMAEKDIGIEANLTSNVQTSTVPDYASHPVRRFLESGLLATLNSDDPAISGIDLAHEYEVAAPAAGLSQDQIRQAQKNALAVAFLSTEEKQLLLTSKRGTSPAV